MTNENPIMAFAQCIADGIINSSMNFRKLSQRSREEFFFLLFLVVVAAFSIIWYLSI